MRVGVLDTWLDRRYLPFWEAYLRELGLEVVRPAEAVDAALARAELAGLEAGRPARLVVARVLELKAAGVDHLLLPDAQFGVESERGGGQNPWTADLVSMLVRAVPGLPPVLRVPAELTEHTKGTAAEVGQVLVRNPQLVRRALERTQHLIRPYTPGGALDASRPLVGLAAEPYLLEDARLYPEVLEALREGDLAPYYPDRSPAFLREEGARMGLRLDLPTDLEFAGAARYLDRLGRVKGVLLLVEDENPAVAALARKIARRLRKPSEVLVLGQRADEAVASLAARF